MQGFLAQRAKASVTYGTAARDYLVQLGADPEHIVVGVNTVDTSYFSERALQGGAEAAALKHSAGSTGIDLLSVGSLVPRKGHSNLLRALAQLPGETPNWHLHLVGGGPLEDKLMAEADGLGLRERVSFWGARRPVEMPLFYAMADIFVLPTLQDIWGLVLNEAMACGVPVIASSLAGATRDLVEHGLNGLEVDPQDLAGFTQALQRLINDSQLRARMGKAASATIQSRATIDHSAAAFMRALHLA